VKPDLSRIEELFSAALARPSAERDSFLQTATGHDPALLGELRRLLAAHATAGTFLESQVPVSFGSRTAALIDRTVGPYRIVSLLGEGGTGIVYAAEQTAPLRRTLALKVIRPGMATRDVLQRFDTERQVLARMDHAGIARVFDAGTTPDGQPFFAMELIVGQPITRYCDERQLPLPDRLRLFIQICEAVQHAHQKGIIHRDLKPSNILVGPAGHPKIIDFGIAKAVVGSIPSEPALTLALRFIGTPAYMAPEQTRAGASSDLDTRCDVYALGVILCELLAGQLPHPPRSLETLDLDELCRRIREDEPRRPSDLVDVLGREELAALAAARQLPPPRLATTLRGDLDWIVLHCLAKDREHRYPSAAALAEDVQRHLAHEPVIAAAPSRAYLLRKFVRRHRAAVLAAAVAAASLVAATALSLAHARRARHAEHAAQVAAETRQAVVDFLRKDILQQASPEEQADRRLTVLEALDRAATKLDSRFPDQPLVEAAIRATLGSTYSALGLYPTAQIHHQRCYDLRLSALGSDDRLTQQALNNVVIGLNDLGRHSEATRLATESFATLTRAFGADDAQTIQTEQTLGSTLIHTGQWTTAEQVLTHALSRARHVFGPTHADTVVILSNLTVCQIQGGRYAEAEPLLRELLLLREKSLGPDHPRTLYVAQNLSAVCAKLDRLDEASLLAERVLSTRERILGTDHPQYFTAALDLAFIRSRQERVADALTLYRTAHAGRLRVLGPDHPATQAAAAALAAGTSLRP